MKKYGKDKPFNDDELFDDIYEIAGDPELPAFVEKYIEGTQELPLKKTLRQVGLDLDTETGKISEMEPMSEAQMRLRRQWIGQ